MKNWVKGAALAMLAIPAVSMSAEPKTWTCYDIKYSLDFLNSYPAAPSICEEVKEIDGTKYAKMSATVRKIEKGYTVVGIKEVFGNERADLLIEAVQGSTVMMGGKEVSWTDLKVGDTLSFWMPERSLHVVGQPGRGKPGAPLIFMSTAN